MIIHKPQIEKKGNKVRVSAYIEVETKKEFSKTLWYEFDKEYEKYISKSLNGFVVAMILFAMYLKEDIKVKGKMSSKLAYGLKQLQGYFNFWYPREFKKIKIKLDGYEVRKTNPKGVMCTFSGGVDSFYTLYSHLPENEDNLPHQVTHCMIMDGFAVPLNDEMTHSYNVIKESYEKMTKKLGTKLVFVTTNISDFYHGKIDPYSIDGPILASPALILDDLISKYYIASSFKYSDQIPFGSNPITDPLLSTEKLDIIHHGCEKTRVKKTKVLAGWLETYGNLRVCWKKTGVKNCCRCEKCIRTMLTLKLAGVLSNYKTFSLPLTRNSVRKWNLVEGYALGFAKEIKNYAKRKGRNDIVFDINYAILRRKLLLRPLQAIYKISAKLKKSSKIYKKFIKLIKNPN